MVDFKFHAPKKHIFHMRAEKSLLTKAKSQVIARSRVVVEEGTEIGSGVGSSFVFLDS